MQTRNPLFNDLAKAIESAIGMAQAAGEEAKSAIRAQGDRLATEFDLVRRDELDALRDTLNGQIADLRAEIAHLKAPGQQVRVEHDGG